LDSSLRRCGKLKALTAAARQRAASPKPAGTTTDISLYGVAATSPANTSRPILVPAWLTTFAIGVVVAAPTAILVAPAAQVCQMGRLGSAG
jgi:hypothetical protein